MTLSLLRLIIPALLLTISVHTQANDTSAPSCGDNCTLVIASDSGVVKRVNPERTATAYSPFSTFKIPNSLIALDLGLIEDLQQPLSFDKSKYPVQSDWPKIWHENPIDLRTAFQHSAVPIYRQLATEIGKQSMQRYLDKFHYGNQDISSGLDNFWLGGSLTISADEQIAFLKSLYHGQLPVKPESLAKLKQVMLVEETPDYRLYAKTGGGRLDSNKSQGSSKSQDLSKSQSSDKSQSSGKSLGWYVGYVENTKGVFYFAMNIEGNEFWPTMEQRLPIMRAALVQAGVLPQSK
ncbi:penicillin-binding transpeptidase domain-containing protein [Shewanella sp. GXUN23E]|uniref:penicillin-binding transpeptidase domain-containing protein n=1 Tax=Shewanella sp. GXUN23E TaxID=3422498 RepID=UPI003D7C9A9A